MIKKTLHAGAAPYTGIAITMLVAVASVIFISLPASKTLTQKNGFLRRFTDHKAVLLNSIARQSDIAAISGATGTRIFFQTTSPAKLAFTDFSLEHQQYIGLNFPDNAVIQSRYDCIADSPDVYLFAGNWPGVFATNLDNGNVTGYKFPSALYTRHAMISPYTIAFRAFDTSIKTSDQIFIKGDPASGYLVREKNISEAKNDMGLSTDGLLHYDSLNHLLVYIHFYSNKILAFDTSLRLIYQKHTIDTLSANRTPTGGIATNTEMAYTAVGPSRFINMESYVSGGLLYNYSLLRADNENENDFKANSVIDTYRLKDGIYIGSFYVPAFDEEKIQRFIIFKNKIIVLSASHICVYLLPAKRD